MDDNGRRALRLAIAAALIDDMTSDEEEEIHYRRPRRQRRWWVKPWRERRIQENGRGLLALLHNELRLEDTESFQNVVRMDVQLLDELLNIVGPVIRKEDTVMRLAIPARMRLAVTLHYLAAGCTFRSLSFYTRIAPNTLQAIMCECLLAIKATLQNICIKTPSTVQEWVAVADRFEVLWNFPHCLGAVDGKHVAFRAPLREKAFYRNYKHSESIVLMALVDAEYKFLFINVGVNGHMNDAGVFRQSSLPDRLSNGTLNLPPPSPLPGRTKPVPYVIVADDAFPLSINLMKPYGGRGNDVPSRHHDYRLSRARRVVENAFGILSNKFRILLVTINLGPAKVELITLACCILHNFIPLRRPVQIWNRMDDQAEEENVVANWQGLQQQQGGNRHGNGPRDIRDEFRNKFTGVGRVPWQDQAVRLHRW